MKLRMGCGHGYLRKHVARFVEGVGLGDGLWKPAPFRCQYGPAVRVARTDRWDIYLAYYTHGERVAGYPDGAFRAIPRSAAWDKGYAYGGFAV
jgi:hypothetical protein